MIIIREVNAKQIILICIPLDKADKVLKHDFHLRVIFYLPKVTNLCLIRVTHLFILDINSKHEKGNTYV